MKPISTIETHRAAIQRVCANRDWRLLTCADLAITMDDFAQRVTKRLQGWLDAGEHAQITEALVERAVIHEYCRLLYHVVGLERTAAQQRALDEIWNYVTPIIRRVLRDDALSEACANDVLLTVWRKRGDVRDPGSFLGWTAMIAGRAALANLKGAAGREIAFSDLFGEGEVQDDAERVEAQASEVAVLMADRLSAFTAVEDAEMAATLATLIRKCLSRMRSGAEVIIRLVLDEQPVSEVSRALGLTAANLYVIKLRALDRLRRCGALQAALDEALAPTARNRFGGR
jgi:RNA polymerase sigma factor (sigma-70 family)